MAKPRKRGNSYQIEFCHKNIRDSATFDTAAECREWHARKTLDANNKAKGKLPSRSLHEAMDRYAEEVSPRNKGARWEQIRLKKLKREIPDRPIASVTATDMSEWRDWSLAREHRGKPISRATVRREMNLLNSVFEVARKEWRWLHANPLADVKKPAEAPSRKRRVPPHEVAPIVRALGFVDGLTPRTKSQKIAVGFLIALESGMRMSEIFGLEKKRLHGKYVTLPETKNGDQRDVPLSPRARELLAMLPPTDGELVFDVSVGTADAMFRRARDRVGLPGGKEGLHFHDSRHEAATQMAKKLDALQLAKVLGHRDVRSVMIYYNPTAEELADAL